ncbi:uncharacterized protein BDZ83DRAFT_632496 [Colletotrichum acutatum]|uniref:Uncharacterized protein n=1 Tax=Glomerella acutata TaxID=27357 RepID=A0AAD8UE82_GLOAC|nr:uncharacterized protein BDZ83DRAFT_632496 [Colletotrichum acutatum]KAK1718882.1 hypothetical protein BDZ83DRAFT_632496 [Colletotrichum acutatum]
MQPPPLRYDTTGPFRLVRAGRTPDSEFIGLHLEVFEEIICLAMHVSSERKQPTPGCLPCSQALSPRL